MLSAHMDLAVIGVNNNSLDGLRTQAFLQQPSQACLSCALPNLDAEAWNYGKNRCAAPAAHLPMLYPKNLTSD